jgi:hypothetical protein
MVSKKDRKTMKEMAFEADKLALIKTQNEQAKALALTDTFDAKEQLSCTASMFRCARTRRHFCLDRRRRHRDTNSQLNQCSRLRCIRLQRPEPWVADWIGTR